jgi:hypothetical protein
VDGNAATTASAADVQAACGGGGVNLPPTSAAGTPSIHNLALAIGNEDGTLTASDFAAVEGLDGGNQISTDCTKPAFNTLGQGPLGDFARGLSCTLDVFVFVDHEGPVTLNLPAGLTSLEAPLNSTFICTTEPILAVPVATTITGATAAAPAVFTTSAAHGFLAGDVITISAVAGAVPAVVAGSYTVATVPSTTTFTLTGPLPAATSVDLTTAGTTATISTVAPLANVFGADNDCSGGPPTGVLNNGDGVVLFHVLEGNASAGSVETVSVSQDAVEQTFDVNVVGSPNNVSLSLAESTVSTSGTTNAQTLACVTNTDVTDAITPPQSTVAIATVTDQFNTKLTRVPVTLTVTPPEDSEIAQIGVGNPAEEITSNTFFSVQPSSTTLTPALYSVICGGKNAGTATIEAQINLVSCALTGCTLLSSEDQSTQTLTVVGPAATNVVTAAASTIMCDGTETSTVTAKVTDAAGNNVADGTPVSFSVVALGTANPINTTTTGGMATSVITPLSNSSAGVTVIVSAGDPLNVGTSLVQTSVRVDCSLPLATQPTLTPPNANPTPRGGIAGPDTGNGGYLGQSSSSGFPIWALIALALGSVTLVAGGLVTRRAGK